MGLGVLRLRQQIRHADPADFAASDDDGDRVIRSEYLAPMIDRRVGLGHGGASWVGVNFDLAVDQVDDLPLYFPIVYLICRIVSTNLRRLSVLDKEPLLVRTIPSVRFVAGAHLTSFWMTIGVNNRSSPDGAGPAHDQVVRSFVFR
jgi:hypothetical protein